MNATQLNILLADDDPDDCIFFKAALEELLLSTSLTAVHDGEQLMQLLNETIQLPHILFLDLNMPRKNGFECLSEIKQNKKLKNLPVAIFSTSFEQEVVNLLYKNGAQYFIRKPSEFVQFKKIILYTLTLIMKKDVSQPTKENFVLSMENVLAI